MTTIVANRTCMSADSMVTDGSTFYHTNKLRVISGCIVGVAGDVAATNVFLDWFRDGGAEGGAPYVELPEDDEDGVSFAALVLSPRGLYVYVACSEPDPLDDPFYAIGTGRSAALAMMKLGCHPTRAVQMASRIDPGTGGQIRTISLADVKKYAKRKR